MYMKELNDVQLNEIRIKQDRLRALLNIDSLLEVSSPASSSDVDLKIIDDFSSNEKRKLVLDIINSLNITEYDTTYLEENGGNTYFTTCTIEESIDHLKAPHIKVNPPIVSLYNEMVNILANYDVKDLIINEVISKYLKMINVTTFCYDDLCLDECKKIV